MDYNSKEILLWQEKLARHLEKNLNKYFLTSKSIIDCFNKPKFKKFNLLDELLAFLNKEDIIIFEEVDTSDKGYSRIICYFVIWDTYFYLSISGYCENNWVYITFSFIRADNINDIVEFEIKGELC